MRSVLGINLYDVLEVAEMLGISKTSVHNYVNSGRLDAQKIGGKFYFTEETIKAFVSGSITKREGDKTNA